MIIVTDLNVHTTRDHKVMSTFKGYCYHDRISSSTIYDVEKDRHNGSKYESDIDEFKERIYEQIDVLAGKFYNG